MNVCEVNIPLSISTNGEFSSAEMSGYKLYYFDVRGRGELGRLAFAAANIEFEDIRLTKDEWAKEKASK